MKHLLAPCIPLSVFLLLSGCNHISGGGQETSSSSVAVSSEEIRETRNVSYRGIVEPLGATITMQGTHSLALGDGRMLLLQSTDIGLDAYVGKEVEVFGALRPTVEAGGIIMRVERITDLSPESSASSQESASSIPSRSSSLSAVTVQSSISVAASSRISVASVASVSSSSRASFAPASVKSSVTALSSAGISNSAELEARIILMSKQDIRDRNWTQQYCTNHIGFCVPVHRNWWFVSFGNTSQTLWHVEVSSESFEGMGSGPISIDLVGGELSGHADKEISVQGGRAIGYRSWTQGRHFRISADARLDAAVRYMAEHLRATE